MNVFNEQSGRIALYTAPRAKDGATIAMLIELLGQPHFIHLVHSVQDIKTDDARGYTSLPVLFDVHSEGKKSASGLTNITRYLLDRYDPEHHFSYKEGSKEAEEVNNWITFLSKTIHGDNAEEPFARKALRLYLHLEEHFQKARSPSYLVGKKCTLADLVIFPYVAGASEANLDLERFPELTSWHERLVRQHNVVKGMHDVQLQE